MSIGVLRKQYTALAGLADQLGVVYDTPEGSFNQKFCELCKLMIDSLGGTFTPVSASFTTRKASYLWQLAIALGLTAESRQSMTALMRQSAFAIWLAGNDGSGADVGASFDWATYQFLLHALLGLPLENLVQYNDGTNDTLVALNKVAAYPDLKLLPKKSAALVTDGVVDQFEYKDSGGSPVPIPAGSTVSNEGTAVLTLNHAGGIITATAGTLWEIVVDNAGATWAHHPCAEISGPELGDTSGNNRPLSITTGGLVAMRAQRHDGESRNLNYGGSKVLGYNGVDAKSEATINTAGGDLAFDFEIQLMDFETTNLGSQQITTVSPATYGLYLRGIWSVDSYVLNVLVTGRESIITALKIAEDSLVCVSYDPTTSTGVATVDGISEALVFTENFIFDTSAIFAIAYDIRDGGYGALAQSRATITIGGVTTDLHTSNSNGASLPDGSGNGNDAVNTNTDELFIPALDDGSGLDVNGNTITNLPWNTSIGSGKKVLGNNSENTWINTDDPLLYPSTFWFTAGGVPIERTWAEIKAYISLSDGVTVIDFATYLNTCYWTTNGVYSQVPSLSQFLQIASRFPNSCGGGVSDLVEDIGITVTDNGEIVWQN